MQTTTPKLNNMTPVTGRMVNEQDEVVNVVDNFGSLKTIGIENSAVHAGISFTYAAATTIAAAGHAYFHGKTCDIVSHLMGFFVKADGTQLLVGKILGDKQTVSSANLDGEWLLKPNTSYIFKVTNNTNQTINVGAGFNWIEAD